MFLQPSIWKSFHDIKVATFVPRSPSKLWESCPIKPLVITAKELKHHLSIFIGQMSWKPCREGTVFKASSSKNLRIYKNQHVIFGRLVFLKPLGLAATTHLSKIEISWEFVEIYRLIRGRHDHQPIRPGFLNARRLEARRMFGHFILLNLRTTRVFC